MFIAFIRPALIVEFGMQSPIHVDDSWDTSMSSFITIADCVQGVRSITSTPPSYSIEVAF